MGGNNGGNGGANGGADGSSSGMTYGTLRHSQGDGSRHDHSEGGHEGVFSWSRGGRDHVHNLLRNVRIVDDDSDHHDSDHDDDHHNDDGHHHHNHDMRSHYRRMFGSW